MSMIGAGVAHDEAAAAGHGHPTPRDLAVNTAILGFAAAAWFGWAQQDPPAGWAAFLSVGSVMGMITTAGGAVAAWRSRGPAGGAPSAMADPANRRGYHRTVGAEVLACVAGAVLLGRAGAGDYVAPWILFVVGVHFLPLARVFRIRSLVPLAAVCALTAVAAVLIGRDGAAHPSAVAGAGGGLALLVESLASLVSWRRLRVAVAGDA
jgi:hypothetical protein